MIKIIRYILGLLIVISPNPSFSDIPSQNAGEQAMISSMRRAIDHNEILKSKKIILGAGISGIEAFKALPTEGAAHVLLTWQWLDGMKELPEATIIIVPSHAIDENFRAIKDKIYIIPIQGVLHTRTLENIRQEDIGKINKNTQVIVMLAGDTQQQDGTWKSYTKSMADELINNLPKDKNILFLNGPRTGKFKEINGKLIVDEEAHRNKTDAITAYVIEKTVGKKWEVQDLKYNVPSLWGPALKYYLGSSDTILILPGESTSMTSEALALGIRPAIYKHFAMTKSSIKYVDQLISENRATLYPTLPTKENRTQEPVELQENIIIKELMKVL